MAVGRPRSLDVRARAAVVALTVAALGGCYKPSITDRGFLCSADKRCPSGYKCGTDDVCALNPVTVTPPVDSGMEVKMMTDAPIVDAGSEAMCMAPTALCKVDPAGSDVCSPSCQKGCDCGRCNVVDGKASCVAAGTVKLGDVCNANADNCAAGLICLLESCGNGLARCYRHCQTNDDCNGTACTITIDDNAGGPTPYTTCDVPPRTCNPLSTGIAAGCPDPALNCYLTSASQTLCDCPTRPATQGGNNAPCMIYSECAPGFICIAGVDRQTTPHCRFVCDVSKPSCPTLAGSDGGAPIPQHCVATGAGATYGYCATQ